MTPPSVMPHNEPPVRSDWQIPIQLFINGRWEPTKVTAVLAPPSAHGGVITAPFPFTQKDTQGPALFYGVFLTLAFEHTHIHTHT